MKTINVKDLEERMGAQDEDEVLIDVRSEDEYEESHIVNARNIPLEKVPEAAEDLKKYKTVFLSCRSGGRSARACDILTERGVNAINVDGGILAWKSSGFSTISDK